MPKTKKILIIVGCSQKKLPHPAPAIDLNQGQLFKSVKKVALQNQFDLKILSGKYGLLNPDEIIEPYNQKIKTKADVKRIQDLIKSKIVHIWRKYDIILTIMGKKYQEVLKPYLDNKFYIIFDKRGIGGYLSQVSHFSKLQTSQLLQEIRQFQQLECAEYLWSYWDFTIGEKYHEPNRPHTCTYCYFNKDICCSFSELYPELYYKAIRDYHSKIEKVQVSSKVNSMQEATLDHFFNTKLPIGDD